MGRLLDDSAAYFLRRGVTVFDDGQRDRLTGSAGLDWFWLDTDLDRATDLKPRFRLRSRLDSDRLTLRTTCRSRIPH